MEPQNNSLPTNAEQPVQQPPVIQAPVKKPKRRLLKFLLLLVLILGGVVAGGTYYHTKTVGSKDKQLKAVQAEKALAESELQKAKNRIADLDSPVLKANDLKRKADLALFANAVKQYKADKSSFPSTLPDAFKKDFADPYIIRKLTNFIDPNTKKDYQFTPVAPVQTPPGLVLGDIQYQWPGDCAGSEFNDTKDETKAAARILLETGETYCLNI